MNLLRGLPASGGTAVGRAFVVGDPASIENGGGGEEEQRRALAALAEVAAELGRTAERMRAAGLADEAEILDANRLMAEDPALEAEVRALAASQPAAAAVRRATEHHADLLAALHDSHLAARAADVLQLGRRAARVLAGSAALTTPGPRTVLVARDLGPAEVADLRLHAGGVVALALAEGAATSHAAIMARSFGVPMAVGLGDDVLAVADGETLVVDGDTGTVVASPTRGELERGLAAAGRRRRARRALAAGRALPPLTRDGRSVRLLCNASTAAEAAAGLEAGAEGVGLLRTELAFLEATEWPTEEEHFAALEPVLSALAGRCVTVRTLDFGADKTPPFLAGVPERGLALLLAHPAALEAQLRAILRAAAGVELRVLLPLANTPEDVRAVRAVLVHAAAETESPVPALGAMVETPQAAARALDLALEADFLSIGTNDLVQYTLGLDRERPLASALSAADPQVLRLVDAVGRAAGAAAVPLEVCGEAAGEPLLVPLLLALGVDELSVAPARLDEVRATVRSVSLEQARPAVARVLRAGSLEDALEVARALLGEARDERSEARNGLGGVLA